VNTFVTFVAKILGLNGHDLDSVRPAIDAAADNARWDRYFKFFATQQCLAAQCSRVTSIDSSLGVLVLVQTTIVLYLLDKAIVTGSIYLYVVAGIFLPAIALALVTLIFIYSTESPEAAVFNAGLLEDADATIDEAVVAMTNDFERNRIKIRTKGRVLRLTLVLTVFLALAAAAQRLIHF
jgi:hypothetical protein